MSEELDRLSTEVAENGAVIDSAVALIDGLAQQIRDLKDDPAALAALVERARERCRRQHAGPVNA